ncbi:MAG: PTS sugar transporter subunit IIA [Alphaproteobacteria bacterium]
MIGLVIVTHGKLAIELRHAMEHVVGTQPQMKTVCIGPDDDMERRREDIRSEITAVDSGEGVLILTDMFGGTPSNLAISLLDEGRVEVLAGANLPMLIKVGEGRADCDLKTLASKGSDAGKRYIAIASEILAGDT